MYSKMWNQDSLYFAASECSFGGERIFFVFLEKCAEKICSFYGMGVKNFIGRIKTEVMLRKCWWRTKRMPLWLGIKQRQ